MRDYENQIRTDLATNEVTKLDLLKSNVIYFELSDNAWCCARPSGTEPKIKFYMGIKGESLEDSDKKLEILTDALMALV